MMPRRAFSDIANKDRSLSCGDEGGEIDGYE